MKPTPKMLTVQAVAKHFAVSRYSIYNLVRRGDIRAIRLGRGPRRLVRIPASEIERIEKEQATGV